MCDLTKTNKLYILLLIWYFTQRLNSAKCIRDFSRFNIINVSSYSCCTNTVELCGTASPHRNRPCVTTRLQKPESQTGLFEYPNEPNQAKCQASMPHLTSGPVGHVCVLRPRRQR